MWEIRICAAICFQMRLGGETVTQVRGRGPPMASPMTTPSSGHPPTTTTSPQVDPAHAPTLSRTWGIRICAAICFQRSARGETVTQVSRHDQPVHMVTSRQHTRKTRGKLMGPKSNFDHRFVFLTLNVIRIHVLGVL